MNNNAGCGFDGGDCCGPDVKTTYCSECECLGENITSKAAPGPFCSCSVEGVLDCKLGTIEILRNQKGGWVGKAKCLRLLTRWLGGCGKMLT